MKIVILEDNEDRRTEMSRCLADRFYQYETKFFDSAAEMTDYLAAHLDETLVISLDHDLDLKSGPDGRCVDPGTGRDVADYLARKAPGCPVLICTTNTPAAHGMERVLREAHWQTQRILPFDDLEWISKEWFRSMRRAIVGSAVNVAPQAGSSPDGRTGNEAREDTAGSHEKP
jgi:hypothetical protein